MAIPKTSILPLDAPDEAHRTFRDMLGKRLTLFVVLGKGQAAQELVSRASNLAGLENEPRWVVWAQQPADLAADIAQLNESTPGFREQIAAGTAAAFTTSFAHEIRDVLVSDEEADNVRVELAYVNAEAG